MKPDGEESSTILIAAALLVGKDDRLLLVRKRGTNAFMQPGGKSSRGRSRSSRCFESCTKSLASSSRPMPPGILVAL
jgi:hypothetical protein